jgi:hydrogenase maturation factor
VPPDQAQTLLAQLKAAGHDAAIIGRITSGTPHLIVT